MSNNKKNTTTLSSVKVSMKAGLWEMPVKDNLQGWYDYGKNNRGFEDLTYLYNSEPHHQSIVDGKAKYVTGTKIVASTPQGEEWLKKWNPNESAFEVLTPVNRNYALVGTRAIKVIPNLLGIPLWMFHLDFTRCRISLCQTKVLYCDDWNERWKYGIEEYPIWYKGCKEPAIMLQKRFKQSTRKMDTAYAGLEYESGLKTIHTLCAIANSRHSLVKNDMGGGSILTIYAPKPESKAEQQEIVDKAKGNYGGDENTGEIAVVWVEGDNGKGAEWSTVPMNGLDKRYAEMNGQAIRDVYAAHGVPPELFKYIKEGSSLFENKNVIINQHELFMNEYVIPEQVSFLKMIKTLYECRYPNDLGCKFSIEQFRAIGISPLDENASRFLSNDEIRSKLGLPKEDKSVDNNATKVISAINSLSPLVANKVLESMNADEIRSLVGLSSAPPLVDPLNPSAILPTVAPVQAAQVNDNLKNLTGKQTQGIMRIVRKFDKGEYSEAQALLLLKSGFGLTDQECKEFLNIQEPPPNELPIQQRIAFAKQIDFFARLDAMAHDSVDDEVLEVSYIGLTKFALVNFSILDAIRNLILNKIKADPTLSVKDIAAITGQSEAVVTDTLKWLDTKKLISGSIGEINIKKPEKKAVVYTEYNYALRPELAAKGEPVIKSTTRKWCAEMYKKYKVGKRALTFDAIDSMSNDLEMNAWDFRGGFNGNDPFCRHIWQGTTKVRYE